MAYLELQNLQRNFGAVQRARRHRDRARRGRVPLAARPVGLRQDDRAPPRCGLRPARWRRDRRRRRGPYERFAEQARHGDGFPGLSLFPNMTARENVAYGLRIRGMTGGTAKRVERAARARRSRPRRRPLSAPALGRHAAACRARARARDRAARAAARRAALGARRKGARAAPRGDPPHSARTRNHDAVRHPRSGGGALGFRSRGRDVRRPDRADGLTGGDVQRARDAVRRGVHRHDEPARGHGRRRRCRARRHDAPDRGSARPSARRTRARARPTRDRRGRARRTAAAARTPSSATS